MNLDVPSRIELEGDAYLRHFTVDDAEALASSVRESLDHLRPWMPWANAQSADAAFQRERLRGLPGKAAKGEEWQYGLYHDGDDRVLGSFGLMTRMGAGTLEIGYWLHVDAGGHGDATRAAGALTEVALSADDVSRVYICCDEANARSAAIPQRLGFTLTEIVSRAPEAPGERGRLMLWARDRDR